jgi:hypothetical protein
VCVYQSCRRRGDGSNRHCCSVSGPCLISASQPLIIVETSWTRSAQYTPGCFGGYSTNQLFLCERDDGRTNSVCIQKWEPAQSVVRNWFTVHHELNLCDAMKGKWVSVERPDTIFCSSSPRSVPFPVHRSVGTGRRRNLLPSWLSEVHVDVIA